MDALTRPPLRSRLSCARRVRISLARCSASIRWTSERSGAATKGFTGVLVAGGMGGEFTFVFTRGQAVTVRIRLDLKLR